MRVEPDQGTFGNPVTQLVIPNYNVLVGDPAIPQNLFNLGKTREVDRGCPLGVVWNHIFILAILLHLYHR